ncbi:hypothetical protein F5B20DRAFT_595373 [Whalleya microplaca]|nr:hypothetical protein F5B20DRAFT_595373 [Whalleya microplaca]
MEKPEKVDPPSPAPSHQSSAAPPITTATTTSVAVAAAPATPVTDEIFQNGFQQLIQHNNAATPSYEPQVDVHSQMGGSNPAHSRYSSPTPQPQLGMPLYDHESSAYAPAQYGGYQQSYQMDHSAYPPLPDVGHSTTPHNAYSTPATSPPTPLQQIDAMTTRSGRAIVRAHGSTPVLAPVATRVEKASPKPKTKKARKKRGKNGEEAPAVVLEAPLSVLVKDITGVHDTDIDEYVNRAPELRRAEVAGSKEGKIKRPMNAFMLYRKAYQNRTKVWKRHDNHQVVSQICGASWNMEPQELRDRYDRWAKVERANHKLAFPEYKFAPAKNKNKRLAVNSKDRAGGHGSDDDGSDLEGYEWDVSAPPSRSESRSARPSLYDPDGDYHPPRTTYYSQSPAPHQLRLGAYGNAAGMPPQHHHQQHHHQSSFQYSNPGKPRPAEYGAGLAQNQYYQQTSEFARQSYSHPHHAMAGYGPMPSYVENVYLNKANSPVSYGGSPVDHYGDMMGSAYPPPPPQMAPQHHHAPQVLQPHPDHAIDPSLMPPQGGHEQYDALGLLSFDQAPVYQDGIPAYQLDPGLGGHNDAQPAEHAYKPEEETAWPDEASAALQDSKLGGDWETLGGEFSLDNIDDILNTTDSPGG